MTLNHSLEQQTARMLAACETEYPVLQRALGTLLQKAGGYNLKLTGQIRAANSL